MSNKVTDFREQLNNRNIWKIWTKIPIFEWINRVKRMHFIYFKGNINRYSHIINDY